MWNDSTKCEMIRVHVNWHDMFWTDVIFAVLARLVEQYASVLLIKLPSKKIYGNHNEICRNKIYIWKLEIHRPKWKLTIDQSSFLDSQFNIRK
jgi:hypothetical protein